jgi:hypothetical protein
MLWAIGFVTGHVIAVPLLVGALSKIFVINPINSSFFATTSSMEFILAFCSGMVLAGALSGLISTPQTLWKAVKKILEKNGTEQPAFDHFWRSPRFVVESAALFISISAFLTYFQFSFIAQIYLVVFTFVCAYQIATIAGKIGLAQLGRFATFVMVPALFIFSTTTIQTVFIATFVELAGGVLTDILFNRKMAYLGSFSDRTMRRYQYLGVLVSALSVGIIFWLLINHFGLGSPALFAQRAQARQLLINVTSFNYYILAIGFVFGYLLKFIHVNPMLVLGGLLMPLNISIGLIAGGLCTMLVKDKEEWYPFWSGVFAANSIWMIIKAVV